MALINLGRPLREITSTTSLEMSVTCFEPFRASEGVEDVSEDGGELMPLRGLA